MNTNNETAAMDIKQAELQVAIYLTLQSQKAAIDASMRDYKEKLKRFAETNPHLMDDHGNLWLEAGYLHIGKRTVVKGGRHFKLLEFVARFPGLLKWELKTAPLKAMFADRHTRKELSTFGINVTEVPRFDIIAARPKVPFDPETLDIDKDIDIDVKTDDSL